MVTVMALLLSGHTLAQENRVGMVYTSTNATDGNSVLMFSRAADGALTSAGSISTEGTGVVLAVLPPGLNSQGAVMLSADEKWLLVVNGGSNDVTVFSVSRDGLEFRSRTNSGGSTPVSVTILGNVVYVLNQGTFLRPTSPAASANVVGFRMDAQGNLRQIPGAVQTLSGAQVPLQVGFAPKGGLLVVTDILTNLIYTLEVDNRDVAGAATAHPSIGPNPYGFAFDGQNELVVSEGNLFVPNAVSSVTSYNVAADGRLDAITASATTHQELACWVSITGDGRFAYVSDTGSGVISAFAIARDGRLTLVNSTGVSGTVAGAPIDNGLSPDSRFLYQLVAGPTDSITGWRTDLGNGSLTLTGTVSGGIPGTASGIAVR
jgi:6-phosphogluconolactonase (cycloisomerase 2 family)